MRSHCPKCFSRILLVDDVLVSCLFCSWHERLYTPLPYISHGATSKPYSVNGKRFATVQAALDSLGVSKVKRPKHERYDKLGQKWKSLITSL